MDFSTVPLLALSIESKQLISTLLNPPKALPSDDGWPRDWRGLAYVLEIPGEKIPLLASQKDPSERTLGSLQEKSNAKTTFKDLQNALEKIDRWDVIDDAEPLFEKDAQQYFERIEKSKLSPEAIENNTDAEMLTVDDLYRCGTGLEKQFYDAFLLYADEDFEFAKEVMERLEKRNLKLCTKDRDLIAGVTFEHEAIMQLISERCNRLIGIISPNFLKSSANKFFLSYAQAVGIDKQQRKLIPFIYKDCELPSQLSFTNKVFYNRRHMYDLWGKLCNSIRSPTPSESKVDNLELSTCNSTMEKAALRVLESSDANDKKIDEKPTDVDGEPELAKCARIASKKHTALLNLKSEKIKNKAKTADESSIDVSEEQVSDSVISLPSLPSLPSLDDIDLLPSYSGTEKKVKSTFMKRVKKMTAKFKA